MKKKPQAVILAAGKSTRTYPLTEHKPKALLEVAGKPIITHLLDAVAPHAGEIILVVGHGREQLTAYVGDRWRRVPVRYVTQRKLDGTGSALRAAVSGIRGAFLLLHGDDIVAAKDIVRLVKKNAALLGAPVSDMSRFGALMRKDGQLQRIVEKPKRTTATLANVGCYMLPIAFLRHLANIKKTKRGEVELVDAVSSFALLEKVTVLRAQGAWLPIAYPWDLLRANEVLLALLKKRISGSVHKSAVLEGAVVVEKGARVLSGVVLQGPVIIKKNAVVGPNCFLRKSVVIGEGAHVGQATEIKNSIIGARTNAAHLSYIGDSIIGDYVNIGAGTIATNLRHDGATVRVMTEKGRVDSGRSKLGAIVADGVRFGANNVIDPGVMVGVCAWTHSATHVQKNVTSFTIADTFLPWHRYAASLAAMPSVQAKAIRAVYSTYAKTKKNSDR